MKKIQKIKAKKIISTVMATALFCSTAPLAPVKATGFSDVSMGNWYSHAVISATERGFIHGYADGTFRPEEEMTGAEFAVVLARAFYPSHLKYEYESNTQGWASPYINTLQKFALDDSMVFQIDFSHPLTREDAASMLCDVLAAHGYPTVSYGEGKAIANALFPDVRLDLFDEILDSTDFQLGKIGQVVDAGFMSGYAVDKDGSQEFFPKDILLRGEAATLVVGLDDSESFRGDLGVHDLFRMEDRLGSTMNSYLGSQTIKFDFYQDSFWDMGDSYLIHGYQIEIGPIFTTIYVDAGFIEVPKSTPFYSHHDIGVQFGSSDADYPTLGAYVDSILHDGYKYIQKGKVDITLEQGKVVEVSRYYTQ